MTFLDGIKGIPLYWMDEPFQEQIDDGRKLRAWMDKNGFEKTKYANGIWQDANDVALEMVGKELSTHISTIFMHMESQTGSK